MDYGVIVTAIVGLASSALTGILTYGVGKRRAIAEARKIDVDADVTLAEGFKKLLDSYRDERDILQRRCDSLRLDIRVLESRINQLENALHRAGIVLPDIMGK